MDGNNKTCCCKVLQAILYLKGKLMINGIRHIKIRIKDISCCLTSRYLKCQKINKIFNIGS